MKKITQKGFSAVVILLALLLVAFAVFAGYYVYNTQQNKKDVTTKLTAASPTATPAAPTAQSSDNKTYSDEYISFNYPNNWTVKPMYTFKDDYNALLINLVGPDDSSVKPEESVSGRYKNLHMGASIIVSKKGRFTGSCAGCGKILSSENSSTSSPTLAGLLVTESQSPDSKFATYATLLNNKATVGTDATNPEPLRLSINYAYNLSVTGDFTDGNVSLIEISNSTPIDKSTSYAQLKTLIESIKINVNKLP